MKRAALVMKWLSRLSSPFLTSTEGSKVFDCLWYSVAKESKNHPTFVAALNLL